MGSQIGSIAGGLAASFFGGPVGAAIGREIGAFLGNALSGDTSDAGGMFDFGALFDAARAAGFDLGFDGD